MPPAKVPMYPSLMYGHWSLVIWSLVIIGHCLLILSFPLLYTKRVSFFFTITLLTCQFCTCTMLNDFSLLTHPHTSNVPIQNHSIIMDNPLGLCPRVLYERAIQSHNKQTAWTWFLAYIGNCLLDKSQNEHSFLPFVPILT